MHQIVERGAAYGQQFGGPDHVAVGSGQGGHHGPAFGFVADFAQIEVAVVIARIFRQPDIGPGNLVAVSHDDGPLDAVFKFTDIARPGVGGDRPQGVVPQSQWPTFLTQLFLKLTKMFDQTRPTPTGACLDMKEMPKSCCKEKEKEDFLNWLAIFKLIKLNLDT